MSKAIQGAAMLAGAVGMGVAAFMDPALVASPLFDKVMATLVMGGIADEAGAIANALTANRGMGITTRQPAAFRQIIYGEQRVGGVLVYESTTGSGPATYNQIIVLAGHPCNALVNLYLDGRQVFWDTTDGNPANQTHNGFNFGGWSDGNDHVGPDGQHYNFGGNVFCSAWYGTQTSSDVDGNLTANDPNWATSSNRSPYLGGCTYIYLHIRYDQTLFPQMPEVRVTVQGKNDIYDPRTSTTGYSQNWALIVADVLQNNEYGFGAASPAVNTDQLIAAANVCDESVPLANGASESRYTCNVSFDTGTTPGDVLNSMMPAAAGRLSLIGGQWFIWPAYWQGPSFTFDQGSLVQPIEWEPYRSYRDLFNHVSGTYISPNYPYAVAGNLYDTNGFAEDGSRQDDFEYAWQKTSFPPYAADTLHGYSADQFTTEDGGIELWNDLDLKCVISVATAQRIAKIVLLRNRFQGSAKLAMNLSAYQMQPTDVMQFTMPALGMTDELLEVTGVRFQVKSDGNGETPPQLYCEIDCQQTDPTIYEWSTTEELTVLDTPAGVTGIPSEVAPPTELTLDSGADTAVIGFDGVTIPRILVSWNTPLDAWVTQIQIQYQLTGASVWQRGGQADVGLFESYISGVVSGSEYNVRIRSLRANGAASPWLEQDDYTVSTTLSDITSSGLNPNSPYNVYNDATITSVVDGDGTTADIKIYGPGGVGSAWDNYTGQGSATYPAGEITGEAFTTTYFVVIDSTTGDYYALPDYNDSLSDSYIPVGSITTCNSGGTGSGSGGGAGTGGTGGGGPRNPIAV